jgi:hypothetical protein
VALVAERTDWGGVRIVPVHVFVDETKERGYLVAAAALASAELATARQTIRALILPRQRRIHFTGESDSRRHKVLAAIADLNVQAVIYDGGGHPNQIRGRAACLTRLITDLAQSKAERLVLELDDAAVKADRALLFDRMRAAGLAGILRYDHLRAHEECLLAIPDAVAWCWARGGPWREKVQGMVTGVRRV